MNLLKPDICVIGGGSAGLSVAAGAVQLGADVVLIEAHKMGGDCLNYGCVPSKALLASSHAAHLHKETSSFGVRYGAPEVNQQAVHDYVQSVIAGIAPHDSVERFEGLGVKVIEAKGKFISPKVIEAGNYKIEARIFVIATGSRAIIPPIPGLEQINYLTNETIFDVTEKMPHLIVLGGGAIGIELAQAHARLGSKVTLIEMMNLMPRDDKDAVKLVRHSLLADDIHVMEGTKAIGAVKTADGLRLNVVDHSGREHQIEGTHLLVAAGRKAVFEDLGLAAAGIRHHPRGIEVDAGLRTSNKRVYALGDVTGGPAFTHVAGYHAGIFIRRALFKLPAKVDYRTLPWVTYSDPEVAQVGLTEEAAKKEHPDCQVIQLTYGDNDRARTEAKTKGLIKIIADKKGHILGVTIAGAQAGELLAPWCLAMTQKLKLSAIAGTVFPYPTLSELNKRAAGQFYTPKLFSSKTKAIIRFLRIFG